MSFAQQERSEHFYYKSILKQFDQEMMQCFLAVAGVEDIKHYQPEKYVENIKRISTLSEMDFTPLNAVEEDINQKLTPETVGNVKNLVQMFIAPALRELLSPYKQQNVHMVRAEYGTKGLIGRVEKNEAVLVDENELSFRIGSTNQILQSFGLVSEERTKNIKDSKGSDKAISITFYTLTATGCKFATACSGQEILPGPEEHDLLIQKQFAELPEQLKGTFLLNKD